MTGIRPAIYTFRIVNIMREVEIAEIKKPVLDLEAIKVRERLGVEEMSRDDKKKKIKKFNANKPLAYFLELYHLSFLSLNYGFLFAWLSFN